MRLRCILSVLTVLIIFVASVHLRPAGLTCGLTFCTLLLALLSGLCHGVHDAEIMLGMLKIGFSGNTVTRACRIPTMLEIFFKKLLGCPTHTDIRSMAIKNMIPVHRDLTIQMPGSTTTPTAGAMISGSHPFYIHELSQHFPVHGVLHEETVQDYCVKTRFLTEGRIVFRNGLSPAQKKPLLSEKAPWLVRVAAKRRPSLPKG